VSDWVRVWRKKDGGRESGDRAVSQAGRPKLSTADVERTSSAAANPAALCPIRHIECLSREHDARIRELEARLLAVSRAYLSADWHLRQVSELLYTEEAGA